MEVNELPSDSPALEMRSQEEAENKEDKEDKEDKEEKGDQSEEEAIGKEEEEDESVAIASVPSTSLKMPDLGPTSLAVCIILCLRHLSSCSLASSKHQYLSHVLQIIDSMVSIMILFCTIY